MRVSLRPVTPEDLQWLQGLNALPEVRRFLFDDESWTADEVRERLIARNEELWRTEGLGLFRITRNDDDASIGWCGFWYYHEPPVREICYAIHPDYWGSGYAREAVDALMRWGEAHVSCRAFFASVDEPNTRSQRLLERLGFTETHRSMGRQHALRHYRRNAGPSSAA